MLGNLHLLAHLILEVNAYLIISLFSPSEKNYFGRYRIEKSTFFGGKMRKQGKNIAQCRAINTALFPNLNGFPLLLDQVQNSSACLRSASVLSTIPASPHWRPCALFPDLSAASLSLLQTETHPSGLPPPDSCQGMCVSPAGGVTAPPDRNTSEELNAQLLPNWTQEACPARWWPFLYHPLWPRFPLVPWAGQAFSIMKRSKAPSEVLQGVCFLSSPQAYTQALQDLRWGENTTVPRAPGGA